MARVQALQKELQEQVRRRSFHYAHVQVSHFPAKESDQRNAVPPRQRHRSLRSTGRHVKDGKR